MSLAEKIPLNFSLLGNGYNWIVIILMVVIAGLALSLLFPATETAVAQTGA